MLIRFNNKLNDFNRLILQTAVFAVFLSGCGQERLEPLNKVLSGVYLYGTVHAEFCTNPPEAALQKIKYLFILDHSASNQPGFPLSQNDISNTDYNGARRYGPLVNFVSQLANDPNNLTYFNIINFNDVAYQPGVPAGGSLPFTDDRTSFLNRVTTDWIGSGTPANPNPIDSGFTNYQVALSVALQRIRTDAQEEAATSAQVVRSSYQIIFVTDGIPEIPDTNNGTRIQDFDLDLRPVLQSILDLRYDPAIGDYISDIVLNTAYYYNDTSVLEAHTLLQRMADEGGGQFMEFGSGRNVLYQQFAPPSRNIRNELIDVFVENKNGLFWDNGQFMLDSDGDGLPDGIEIQHGSDSNSVDSDGNGVSDLVEYRTKGTPCDSPLCAFEERDRYAICAGFSPVIDSTGRTSFESTTNDGFNDCEKYLINASTSDFNTNGNLIPDQYAFKSGLPVTVGSGDVAFSDPYADGLSNYSKLKLGLPIQSSSRSMIGHEVRETSLEYVGSPEPSINCYSLNVRNIALAGANDVIKIMVVQNASLLEDRPFLKVAERSIDGRGVARFTNGDFQ